MRKGGNLNPTNKAIKTLREGLMGYKGFDKFENEVALSGFLLVKPRIALKGNGKIKQAQFTLYQLYKASDRHNRYVHFSCWSMAREVIDTLLKEEKACLINIVGSLLAKPFKGDYTIKVDKVTIATTFLDIDLQEPKGE